MDLLVEVAFNLVRAFLISCLFKQVLTAREDGRLKRMIGVLCVEMCIRDRRCADQIHKRRLRRDEQV